MSLIDILSKESREYFQQDLSSQNRQEVIWIKYCLEKSNFPKFKGLNYNLKALKSD